MREGRKTRRKASLQSRALSNSLENHTRFQIKMGKVYGEFSHDVTAAILVSQNNDTAAILEPIILAIFVKIARQMPVELQRATGTIPTHL